MLNKLIKVLAFIAIHFITFIMTFFVSVSVTSVVFVMFLSIWNLFTGSLPAMALSDFLLYFLLWCVPLTLVFYTSEEIKMAGLTKDARAERKEKNRTEQKESKNEDI